MHLCLAGSGEETKERSHWKIVIGVRVQMKGIKMTLNHAAAFHINWMWTFLSGTMIRIMMHHSMVSAVGNANKFRKPIFRHIPVRSGGRWLRGYIYPSTSLRQLLERVWNEYTPHLIGPNFMYAKVSNTSLYPLSQVDHEVVILRISFTWGDSLALPASLFGR